MATNPDYLLDPATTEALKALGYTQMSISTWRADAEDVMIFVSIMPVDKQICGHLTRKNMVGPTDKPYSPTWATPFEDNTNSAILVCARHMLDMAEEHLLAGSIRFQQYGTGPDERLLVLSTE